MLLFFKLEFIKEAVFKGSVPMLMHMITRSFYTLTNTGNIFLIDFTSTTPEKY